jgi:hypothetical protein
MIGAILAASVAVNLKSPARADAPTTNAFGKDDSGAPSLHWLEGGAPAFLSGVTWGVPWPRGMVKKDQVFSLQSEDGAAHAMQSWPLAYWPDGSLKWTAHAAGPEVGNAKSFQIKLVEPPAPEKPIQLSENEDFIELELGSLKVQVGKRGNVPIRKLYCNGKEVARSGQLVAFRTDSSERSSPREVFFGEIKTATIEQPGPVRAVVRLDGTHVSGSGRAWLPFTLRLYFYAGGETVRMMHTFIFDGDEQKDFIAGLGMNFIVPMSDALHDRHIRFVGEDQGLFAEGIRNITGLRRDPGREIRAAQVDGKKTPPLDQWDRAVSGRIDLIPAWGDFTLSQLNSDGFQIRKRTREGFGWISAGAGHRAGGTGYIGGASGGMAFGIRDFWQKHPSQLDIRHAASDNAVVTMWLWSPDAPPMDLRFYHDGMGMDTHPKELEGLNITYEDYEKGFGTPVGIARTSEMTLWPVTSTPSREALAQFADAVRAPAVLVCNPTRYLDCQVFGAMWSLPDRSTPMKKLIEDELDASFDYYKTQPEQRRWYGFWDYGDVMHSYDGDRHSWRYDVGGYAWANSELSPDLWLWYSFLRTGRADVFRFAEAMTRHTGEVDVYHLGRFKGLGSRHNVQHWGCSAKQLRISTAVYRRIYYYLTADERVGDLMRELVDADNTFLTLDPIRKIRKGQYEPAEHALAVGFGTDWGSLASAWLTEWERTLDEAVRMKLENAMKTIGAMPHGFFTSGATYDLAMGKFSPPKDDPNAVGFSHLSAVFGLPETVAELLTLFDVPDFEKAWLQYCELSNLSPAERAKVIGGQTDRPSLVEAHSRLTAYAAWKKKDRALALRAAREFLGKKGDLEKSLERWKPRRIEGPDVLNPIDEAQGVSTNGTSQWGLAAMQVLALVGNAIDDAL